jgi:L-ascorbate metabolism protein UlaG (beta-lactamase superfamily)
MALIQEFYRPDIGIVPIGDRFTMNGRTAAVACRRYFNFSTVLPCHYRTFPLLDQSADSFVESMAEDGGKVKVLDFGQNIEV